MRYSENSVFIFLLFSMITIAISGCGPQKSSIQDILNQPIEKTGQYKLSKKYIRAGITVVYLTGSPCEIGLANGKLCKNEIWAANKPFFDIYEKASLDPQNEWLRLSKNLEQYIPKEYLEEMRGIADGAEIEYDKVLFLNTLTTISMGNRCFAFAFKETNSKIVTLRQIDNDPKSFLYKNMILYIIKPQKGFGFAAILNPGWVDGESGMNEK